MAGWFDRLKKSRVKARNDQLHPPIKQFQYTELKPGETRLLVLHPAPKYSKLRGSLRDVDPNDNETCPPFTALSYVCGPYDRSKAIYLDGCPLKISANLHRILCQIRAENDAQHFWVDAICINQTHMPERMEQVKRIGDVYACANYVLAWLDLPEYQPSFITKRRVSVLNQTPRFADRFKHMGPDTVWRDYFQALFNNKYWSRRWIVQEVLQAKDVQISIGNGHMFSFGHFGKVLEDESILKTLGSTFISETRDSLIMRLWQERTRSQVANASLDALIRRFHSTQCEDPKDKVFALLSLSGPDRHRYRSSYETPLVDVLLEVVEICSRNPQFLDSGVLGFATYLRSELGISRDQICHKIAQLRSEEHQDFFLRCPVSISGKVSLNLGPDARIQIPTARPCARSLLHYGALAFDLDDEGAYTPVVNPDQTSEQPQILWNCSKSDLQAFVCAATWNANGIRLGIISFASRQVSEGDEVWYFKDTELALIVHPEDEKTMRLIARAQSIDQWCPRYRVGAARNHILVDKVLLLTLILWTTFDDEVAGLK